MNDVPCRHPILANKKPAHHGMASVVDKWLKLGHKYEQMGLGHRWSKMTIPALERKLFKAGAASKPIDL